MYILIVAEIVQIERKNIQLLRSDSPYMMLTTKLNLQQNENLLNYFSPIQTDIPFYFLDCTVKNLQKYCKQNNISQSNPTVLQLQNQNWVFASFDINRISIVQLENYLLTVQQPFVEKSYQDCYFVLETEKSKDQVSNLIIPYIGKQDFVYQESEQTLFYANRDGIKIEYYGSLDNFTQFQSFITKNQFPFLAQINNKNLNLLYSDLPLLIFIGRYIRDQEQVQQVEQYLKDNHQNIDTDLVFLFLDLQEYAIYTEQFGINKRFKEFNIVVKRNKQFYKEKGEKDTLSQVKSLITNFDSNNIQFQNLIQQSTKQVKLHLEQSYTPPSDTVLDRIIQVYLGTKDYTPKTICGILFGSSLLILSATLTTYKIIKNQ